MFRKALVWGGVAGVAMVASVAVAGLEYKCVVTSVGETKDSSSKATTKMWVDQDRLRAETIEGQGVTGEKGGYMLTTNAGTTMYMVDPSQKSYMVWDMGRMMGAMSMVQMKVSNNTFEKVLEEDGGIVMGYPTRHYRFRTSYDMEVSVFGMKNKSSCTQEEDLWSTTKIKHTAMDAWAKTSMKMVSSNPELAKLVDMRMQKMEGVPVKMVTVSTTKGASDAKPTTTKTTMEFVEIKETAIPASVFEIPKGYTEMVMPTLEDQGEMRKVRQAQKRASQAKAKVEEEEGDAEATGEGLTTEIKNDIKAEAQQEVDSVKAIPPTRDEVKEDIKGEIKQEIDSSKPRAPTRDEVKEAIKNKLRFW